MLVGLSLPYMVDISTTEGTAAYIGPTQAVYAEYGVENGTGEYPGPPPVTEKDTGGDDIGDPDVITREFMRIVGGVSLI